MESGLWRRGPVGLTGLTLPARPRAGFCASAQGVFVWGRASLCPLFTASWDSVMPSCLSTHVDSRLGTLRCSFLSVWAPGDSPRLGVTTE